MSPTPTIQTSVIYAGEETFITAFAPGHDLVSVGNTHPNFKRIVELAAAEVTDPGTIEDTEAFVRLFDPEASVKAEFERLTDRVTVEDGVIHLDGDPVIGALQSQILDFLEAGEDFEPLLAFYEKLTTNPLGNVQEGLFTWVTSQREGSGSLTITPEGDLIGYKSVHTRDPEWRDVEEGEKVYVPSRRGEGRVNDEDVPGDKYIEQVAGDVVEMPRSKVLNAPSIACGDGLHIGTYNYAKGFQGDTVLLVKFSPRDVVSLPDTNATWKLRVCRYTVLGACDGPLDVPLYITQEIVETGELDDAADDAGLEGELYL